MTTRLISDSERHKMVIVEDKNVDLLVITHKENLHTAVSYKTKAGEEIARIEMHEDDVNHMMDMLRQAKELNK